MQSQTQTQKVGAQDTCRLAAELSEEYGDLAFGVAQRAVAIFRAEGMQDRADFWCVLEAILVDIAAKRFDPRGHITLH